MKYFFSFFSAFAVTALLIGCAGNKDFQERPPAQLGQAYTTSNANSYQLFIPVNAIQTNRVSLDSVHFRGMSAVLEQDATNPGLYSAFFNTGKPDLIMSSDPKEEYQNKMPRSAKKSSYELKDDEAVLVFSQNNKVKYYKLTGIREGRGN